MKTNRHLQILELIEENEIETQEELAVCLKEKGIDVTQATVSRDIKELNLIKVPSTGGRYKYSLPYERSFGNALERLERMFKDAVLHVEDSENIIVIKMLPGTAQGLASIIDGLKWREILGTVAGDDTIFLVIKPKEAVAEVKQRFIEKMR